MNVQPKRKRRLWLWFAAGFLIVFIGMCCGITMYPMHPSGNAVIGCKLWQYYLMEFPQMFSPYETLGPATGSSATLAITVFEHLLCSAIGGAVMVGIGWIVHKVKCRRA
jgi:hypothetical protein